ncbi:hypothetical protein PAXRUDRAFT_830845 [Paxillus rubicundulus Ve08.2h10]|uniref:Uncharacterized protein n=1 Tax=Paxillus rubicundulus Ve08.2h10 TaxID=930991 RepID=A0A0D0D4J8_9AGAM|nr:hypothetical protein PAXRUDRAFT_830845 [Paxillus rubicundulus Ve08.2h10]
MTAPSRLDQMHEGKQSTPDSACDSRSGSVGIDLGQTSQTVNSGLGQRQRFN